MEKAGGAWEYSSWWDLPAELPVGTWVEHSGYFIPSASANYYIILKGGENVGDHCRFDDLSVKEVTSTPMGGS